MNDENTFLIIRPSIDPGGVDFIFVVDPWIIRGSETRPASWYVTRETVQAFQTVTAGGLIELSKKDAPFVFSYILEKIERLAFLESLKHFGRI